MITLENAICFTLGMAIVYMMFRSIGVLLVLLLLTIPGQLHAQTNFVWVANSDALPVVVTAQSTSDVMPSVLAGMAFGFTCCGFGWVLRTGKKVADF